MKTLFFFAFCLSLCFANVPINRDSSNESLQKEAQEALAADFILAQQEHQAEIERQRVLQTPRAEEEQIDPEKERETQRIINDYFGYR